MKKLEPHMLYCYNRTPEDATSTLYYLYMVDSNTAFLFPHFRMLDITDGYVLLILNSKTWKESVYNLRPAAKYPCDVRPCTIYQKGMYVCLGLMTPYRIFPQFPDMLDCMCSVEVRQIPPFTKGKIYKNTHTGKRYEYISQNGLDFDELLFKECITQDLAIFEKGELEDFAMTEADLNEKI